MRKYVLIAAVGLFMPLSALAQTQNGTSSGTDAETPAVATPDTNNPSAPVPGENSFTEEQARERMQEAGYTDVKDLKLDDKGFWNATAMKGQTSVNLVMDYQGNVVTK